MTMTDEQCLELDNAIELAVASHQGARDKTGEPYILHVLRVMLAVPPHLRVTGVLHDIVEDTAVTVDELPDHGISGESCAIIDVLTRREGEEYDSTYLARLAANPGAVLVKLADLADNVSRSYLLRQLDEPEARRLMKRYTQAMDYLNDVRNGKPVLSPG